MLCHLPKPYPAELLYSVIARYLGRIGVKNGDVVANHIFGRRFKAQVDVPRSLDAVSKRTWPIWRMTGKDIANDLTIFPYYARYLPSARLVKCFTALLSDKGGNILYSLGVTASRVKVSRYLRFCNICRESDISKYGETYWHRSHQLTGVLVCPEHGELLINSRILMRPTRRGEYIDATHGTVNATLDNNRKTDLSKDEIINALKISKRCQEMLLGQISNWGANNTWQLYRQAAMERGFVNGGNYLSHRRLGMAFIAFFGETLLSKLGCEVDPRRKGGWLTYCLSEYRRQKTFQPVEHALIQIFLESVPVQQAGRAILGFGPWKCPNPYSNHEEKFPIKKVEVSSRNNIVKAHAKCKCGFHFSFLRTDDADRQLPVVLKVSHLGPTWKFEVARLKQCGLSIGAIAKKMKISCHTVRRLLGKEHASTAVTPAQITELRQEWLELIDKVPNRSRRLAAKENKALFNKLRYHDWEWLYAEPSLTRKKYLEEQKAWGQKYSKFIQSRNLALKEKAAYFNNVQHDDHKYVFAEPKHRHRMNTLNDWANRDKEWSWQLRTAAKKIKEAVPLKWASRKAIIEGAGFWQGAFNKLDHLPECSYVLSKCSESLEDYRERRLRAATVKRTRFPLTLRRL